MRYVYFVMLMVLIVCMLPGAKVVPLPGLTNPDSIRVDDANIYITQFPEIRIYSRADFKLKKTFGRKGEGPREVLKYAQLYVLGDSLMVGDRFKVLYFTKTGDYIKELKAKSRIHWGVMPLGNKFVGKAKAKDGKVEYDTAVIYSPQLEKEKEAYRYRFFYTEWKGGKKCDAVEVRGIQYQTYDNKIFAKRGKDFIVDVLDHNGKKLYSIKRDYEKIKITEADKKRYIDYFKATQPWKRLYDMHFKNEIFFPDYFPAIQLFLVQDEKIYVLTYKKEAGKSEFVILDLKGKLLKKIFLPLDTGDEWFQYSLFKNVSRKISNPTFTIKDGVLYQLIENPDTEEWELHIIPLFHLKY
ncbi:MAG: hypothetical protein GY950_32950 [bacterium]|nr:hypothetical protein [bacterium]